jgi:hypothetical protein
MTPIGFPHSDIAGSKVVCTSPTLIAAYHVLHRLPVPRHPPDALSSLTENPSCQIGKSFQQAFDLSPQLGLVSYCSPTPRPLFSSRDASVLSRQQNGRFQLSKSVGRLPGFHIGEGYPPKEFRFRAGHVKTHAAANRTITTNCRYPNDALSCRSLAWRKMQLSESPPGTKLVNSRLHEPNDNA